jgi:single-strand DNA-binding protein
MNILNFGMAVNDRRRNSATGEWEDYANFVDCVLFGNRADFLSRTLHKGIKVVVEGKLRYSSWERDGQRRSKLEVVVDDLDFITPRQQGNYQPGGYSNGQQGGYQSNQQSYSQQAPSFNAATPAPAAQPSQMYDQGMDHMQQAPVSQSQRPVVTNPPQEDVYDEDIPF